MIVTQSLSQLYCLIHKDAQLIRAVGDLFARVSLPGGSVCVTPLAPLSPASAVLPNGGPLTCVQQ